MISTLIVIWLVGSVVNTAAFVYAIIRYSETELKDMTGKVAAAVFVIGIVASWGIPLYYIGRNVYMMFKKNNKQ